MPPIACGPLNGAGELPHAAMEQAADWYALLISGEARDEDRVHWRAWLEADPGHRQAWGYVERVSQRVLAPLRETPDPRLTTGNLHAATLRVLRRRRALAGIAALAGAGLIGRLAWRQNPFGTMAMAWTADYRTGTGEMREVALSDGTQVWLNTASAFDQDFQPGLRRLRLVQGEILIATGADTTRPFVVDTPQGRLRALGTRFTVHQEDGRTFLAVYQGAVEIRPAHGGAAAIIPAGRQTRFTADAIQPAQPADPAREAWSRGDLVVSDLALEEVVKELGRYTAGHIGVAPSVARRRVFGTFPLHDVDATLAMLAEVGHLRIRRPLPWWTTLEAAQPGDPARS